MADSQPGKIEVDVYKSRRSADTYIYLPADDPIDSIPEGLHAQFGEAEAFLRFELTADRVLAQADALVVLQSLHTQGFYLQLPPRNDED